MEAKRETEKNDQSYFKSESFRKIEKPFLAELLSKFGFFAPQRQINSEITLAVVHLMSSLMFLLLLPLLEERRREIFWNICNVGPQLLVIQTFLIFAEKGTERSLSEMNGLNRTFTISVYLLRLYIPASLKIFISFFYKVKSIN